MIISHHAHILAALITLALADTATTWYALPSLVARKISDPEAAATRIQSHRRFLPMLMVPYALAACLAAKMSVELASLTPAAILAACLVADMILGIHSIRHSPTATLELK
jgi:hypothetical protein